MISGADLGANRYHETSKVLRNGKNLNSNWYKRKVLLAKTVLFLQEIAFQLYSINDSFFINDTVSSLAYIFFQYICYLTCLIFRRSASCSDCISHRDRQIKFGLEQKQSEVLFLKVDSKSASLSFTSFKIYYFSALQLYPTTDFRYVILLFILEFQ